MIRKIQMITGEYLEIVFDREEAPAEKEAAAKVLKEVLLAGVPVEVGFESYFDCRGTWKLAAAVTEDRVKAGELTATVADSGSAGEVTASAADGGSAGGESALRGIPVSWEPWYTFREELAEDATAIRRNQGTKSKLWVLGNESSGCTAADPKYTAEYVIQYCTEGINKIAGRSDFITLAASRSDLRVVVVGDGVSVYEVPEVRHLYREEDAMTRVVVEGSRELPIIVTTARDVMRCKEKNNNTFEMLYAFAKLYWELGVKDGTPLFALSVYDDENTYNYVKHVEEAYAHAKETGLWPGTRMMDSVEEYFAWGTMVWYLAMEESEDGSWQREKFPVNTRCEMLDYDPMLHGALVEIYGEFEYFSGYREQHREDTDDALRRDFPWYKHNQTDNYDIHGRAYEPLKVEECNLISADQIELIFNREVRDLGELRKSASWTIAWEKTDGSREEFTGEEIVSELYQWKTLTLRVPGKKFYRGYIGSDVTGFTEEELRQAADPESAGYKPWLFENGYARTLDGVVVSPKIYDRVAAGPRKPCPDEENPIHAFTVAEKITVEANPGAIDRGVYVNFSDPATIPEHLKGGIDGRLLLTFHGHACDWADNALSAGPYTAAFRPWLGQVMRSERTGVYVYGDPFVRCSTLALTCKYWDLMLSNETDHMGQRIADGLVYAHGGAEIMSYHHHAYQMSGQRSTCDVENHFYLYVEGFGGGICQTTEANVTRNYTYTRYDNEFILGHEGAHSIEITGMPWFTDLNALVQEAYAGAVMDHDLWNNGGLSYAGSNRAEYFATLTNIWHSTMRESTDGSNNGTWLSINTREELYVYDRRGYEMAKTIYYNGHAGVNAEAVNRGIAEGRIRLQDADGHPILHYTDDMILPGWDREGRSINDDVIRWGSSFPADELRRLDTELSAEFGEDTYFRWVSWSVANQWDINDDHDPDSGICYGRDAKARYPEVNYNPYLKR